jgi:hypothetical protein
MVARDAHQPGNRDGNVLGATGVKRVVKIGTVQIDSILALSPG